MNCPYEDNGFCLAIDAETRRGLCAHCRIKHFGKWQHIFQQYWEKTPTLLLSGMMIFGEPDDKGTVKIVTNGIAVPPSIISPGTLIDIWNTPSGKREVLCLTDCAIASFDPIYTQSLFDSHIEFTKLVYNNILKHCSIDKGVFMKEIYGLDSYAAVRFVICFCRDHGIKNLTHEQIALICNRRRPTVSAIMKKLIRQEPDLLLDLVVKQDAESNGTDVL